MLQLIAKVVFSILLSNWLYSEAVLFFPPFEDISKRFVEIVRVPTHDEWDDIATSPEADVLERELNAYSGVAESQAAQVWKTKTGRQILGVVRQTMGSLGYRGPQKALFVKDDSMFLQRTAFSRLQDQRVNQYLQPFQDDLSFEAF